MTLQVNCGVGSLLFSSEIFWYNRATWVELLITNESCFLPNILPLTAEFLSVCVPGIRRGLWTACMRRCRAPGMAHRRPSPAAHPAVPAAAPAARRSCWMTTQSGEALEGLYPWWVWLYHRNLNLSHEDNYISVVQGLFKGLAFVNAHIPDCSDKIKLIMKWWTDLPDRCSWRWISPNV